MAASIDHAIWFHAPFRADEWLLYEMASPVSSSGRGLSFGSVYKRDGTLVMSVAQEGLARTTTQGKARKKGAAAAAAAGGAGGEATATAKGARAKL